MSKSIKVKVGLPGKLNEITAEIPDAEPRPWDGTDKLKLIGSEVKRIDGKYKTTGKAKYSYDINLPGMLYGKILRSPYPAAIIKKIDTSKAKNYPGVKAIVFVQDELPLELKYEGQEILAVAATTSNQAEAALKLIAVEYEKSSFVIDLQEAQKESSHKVYKEQNEKETATNIRGPNIYPKEAQPNEIDALLESSDQVINETYKTQVQTHSPMETHGLVANWEEGNKLTIWASTQATFRYRDNIADYFDIPKTNVRVLTKYMGGGFGSKLKAWPHGFLACKLSQKSKLPVKLMLNRKEEHLATGNRPNSIQQLTIGAKSNGKITGIKLKSYGTAGIGTGAGVSGPAKWIYDAEKIYTEEYDVFTNAGPGAPFRAPGHPQGVFALEQTIDTMAYALKMDPLEFRKINTLSDDVRQEEYKIGAEKFGWKNRNPLPDSDKGIIKRGVGVANSLWYYIYRKGFDVSIRVNDDGSIRLTNGVQDIGGGTGTILAMVAAEELGLKPSDIEVVIGDTNYGLGPTSGGSQTISGISPAARNAAYLAKQRMIKIAAKIFEMQPDNVEYFDRKFFKKDDQSNSLSWEEVAQKIPGGQFTVMAERQEDHLEVKRWKLGGVQLAEVEVDTETGVVKVNKIVAVHDCGRPMDRLTLQSQINGGIIQGISYALFENRLLDRNTGNMVNANFDFYKIAGSLDMPEIESVIIDYNEAQNSTGAMGIGEPATVPTAAAIANAIYHAIGVRIHELPMTPDKILAALEKAKGGVR